MHLFQACVTADIAHMRLQCEAGSSDPDLRRLVGHGGIYDGCLDLIVKKERDIVDAGVTHGDFAPASDAPHTPARDLIVRSRRPWPGPSSDPGHTRSTKVPGSNRVQKDSGNADTTDGHSPLGRLGEV